MRYGYCASSYFMGADDPRGREIFEAVLAAGYDYVETQLTMLLDLSPERYREFKRMLTVPCKVAMMIFPYSMPLVSEDRDLRAVTEHAKKTLAIAEDLGCELLVFGHGGTRAVPEGMAYDLAYRRLVEILQLLGSLSAIKIAVEPLCDTNMITSYPEAAKLARDCGESVGAVFDLYHSAMLGQTPADILQAPDKLFHLHIANPTGRALPAQGDDYAAFADAAKQCNYNKRISVEANLLPEANAARAITEALHVTRNYFSEETKR